jgi:HTH-type transcriptional regulator, sugar sensing transcriptional regulator
MTTLYKDLYATFHLVGFNPTQTVVYLSVLELGASSIWDIAQKSGVKRPTCYAVLDHLMQLGYASKTNDGRRLLYSVVTPKELLARFDQKKSEFASSLPVIEGFSSHSSQRPRIRLYEGLEGVKQVYASMLTYRNTELLVYGTNDVLLSRPEIFDPFIEGRLKQNIPLRIILARTPNNVASTQNDAKLLRETRFFPPEKFNPSEDIDIIGDTIFHIAHSENHPFATAIESSSFARHEREKFDLLWEIAEKI